MVQFVVLGLGFQYLLAHNLTHDLYSKKVESK